MGLESEHAVSAWRDDGTACEPHEAANALLDTAAKVLIHVRDVDGKGMFLADGSRLYRDGGSTHCHVEGASAEVPSPIDLLGMRRATERMLVEVADLTAKKHGFSAVVVSNITYCYANPGVAFGSHSNLSCDPYAAPASAMLPFLASRVVLIGSGSLNPLSAGIRFMVSPRALFTSCARSSRTEYGRGMIDLLNLEKARFSGNAPRYHCHCADGGISDLSLALRFGCMGLVAAAFEAGGTKLPLEKIGFSNDEAAVAALKTYAADPTCLAKAETRGGYHTAVEIQWCYLRFVQSCIDRLPEWAPLICDLWLDALTKLEAGPGSLARNLDWCIKHRLFDSIVRRSRFQNWEQLQHLSGFAERLEQMLKDQEGRDFMLTSTNLADLPQRRLASMCRQQNCGGLEESECLMDFLQLREQLCVLDLKYMKLGPLSLFSQLLQAGKIEPCLPGIESNDEDGDPLDLRPPSCGRARSRGRLIATYGGREGNKKGYACSWHQFTGPGLVVDFPDVGMEVMLPQAAEFARHRHLPTF